MKKYINRLVVLSGCAAALVACDENSWNNNLDGFDVPVKSETQTIDYTMTSVDYATLAGLSTAKDYAGVANSSALKAVGSQGYFTDVITAEEYIPFFLEQERFPYFMLDNGSVVRVTYNTVAGQPDVVTGAASAEKYTVSTEDYITAWGDEENYTEAFTPSVTAARNLPKILKAAYPDAESGDYVVVNYNQSATDPVFNATEEPEFEYSSVLGSLVKGSTITINGYVAAVSSQGPIVSDAAGSVFVYKPSNNADLKVGDLVTLTDVSVSTYNYGFQIAQGAEAVVAGNQNATYPEPKTWTGAEVDAFVAAAMATDAAPVAPVYSKFTGNVVVSGSYINIIIDGTTVQISPYGASDAVKAELVDGSTVTFEGYVMAIASKGKYLNTVITKIGEKAFSTLAVANAASRAVEVASESLNAIYKYDGSAWTSPSDMVVLNHADYQAMGQKYDNLSGETPQSVIPTFLGIKYPYAQADEVRYVVYNYYNGSSTVIRCAECVFNGTEWTGGFNGTTVMTAQFVKVGGKWGYSPDVTITLPAGKGVEISTLYYQTCVDWVAKNVENGAAYVSSYGNNEYYCGTSAYQGNVDLRPSAAKTQYAGYADMTDDEVVALEKTRFESEVFPAALSILHQDAAPTAGGIIPVYTINFYYYDGVTKPATIIYHVTAPAKFEFVSCTWND